MSDPDSGIRLGRTGWGVVVIVINIICIFLKIKRCPNKQMVPRAIRVNV